MALGPIPIVLVREPEPGDASVQFHPSGGPSVVFRAGEATSLLDEVEAVLRAVLPGAVSMLSVSDDAPARLVFSAQEQLQAFGATHLVHVR